MDDAALRMLSAARHEAAVQRKACAKMQFAVLEQANQAMIGQPSRRHACQGLFLESARVAEATNHADEALEAAVNGVVATSLRAVRTAAERQAGMDQRERELAVETARLEASERLIAEERRRLAAERELASASEQQLRDALNAERIARRAESLAVRRTFGDAIFELEQEVAAAHAGAAAVRARCDAALCAARAQFEAELQAERDGSAREARETRELHRRSRERAEAVRDAATRCLASEVTRVEEEKAGLRHALRARVQWLSVRTEQLEADKVAALAELRAARDAEAGALHAELERTRHNLQLARAAVPPGPARQLIDYEKLKDPTRDRETSMSWRGTRETLGAHAQLAALLQAASA